MLFSLSLNSDIVHIQHVAAEWGEGCIEQVETGVELATDQWAEKRLQEEVRKHSTLTVISATAAMINMQCLVRQASEVGERTPELARQNEQD